MTIEFANLAGNQYGRLRVLYRIGTKHESPLWLCGCFCGNYATVNTASLRRTTKPTRSCGECNIQKKYYVEWTAWMNMKARCYNENNDQYKNYGGRGIYVAQEWLEDALQFIIDMGLRPAPNLSVERKDVNGPYSKDNCIWADDYTQVHNRRKTYNYINNLLARVEERKKLESI